MFRILPLICVFSFLWVRCTADELVYVHCSALSEKNIKEFQQICDQTPGVKFLGFCHDLSIVQFDIDRSLHSGNDVLFMLFKKSVITDFSIQSHVEQERFMDGCKRFQSRN